MVYRWMLGILGFVIFGYALAVGIYSAAAVLPLNSHIYTWLINDGYKVRIAASFVFAEPPLKASDWNLGLAYLFAIAAVGLLMGLFMIEQFFVVVKHATTMKRVNGLRTIINVAAAIPTIWFLAAEASVRDAVLLIGFVLLYVVGDLFMWAGERENSGFLKRKLTDSNVTKKSYFANFAIAGMFKLFFVLLWGTYFIDALLYDTAVGHITHRWVFASLGSYEAFFIILSATLSMLRYARCDTGCLTAHKNFEAIQVFLVALRLLLGVTAALILIIVGL
jgi:hypothetical protein